MKKTLLILMVSAFYSTYVNAQFVRPVAEIKEAATLPVLDGQIDAVWALADAHSIENPVGTPTLGPSGTTYWKALWAPDGIYILINVNDNIFFPAYNGSKPTQSWLYDKAEIYLDVNEILEDGGKWGSGHYQIAPGFTKDKTNGEIISGKDNSGIVDIQYAFKVSDPTWIGEYFIPYAKLKDVSGNAMDKTREIGFDIYLIDVDTEGVINQATWGQSGDNLDNAGIINLQGAGEEVFASDITLSSTGNATTITTDNGTLQMIPTVLPANTWNKTIKWTITFGTGKASISESGLVTAIKDGTVTVVGTSFDGTVSSYYNLEISGQTATLDEVNIIKNGNFDNGLTSWDSWAEVGAGTAAVVENGVALVDAKLAANIWLNSLSQTNLQALPNIPYILRFVASSDVPRTINVNFQDNPNNYNNFGTSADPQSNGKSSWTFPITTVPTTYTFHVTFTEILDNTVQTFEYFLAQADGVVSIDSIYLVEEAELILSVPSPVSTSNIKVYPNPLLNELNFSDEVSKVKVTNLLGQVIMEYGNAYIRRIVTTNLKSGIYFVSFTDSNGIKTSAKMIRK